MTIAAERCRVDDKPTDWPSLPKTARLPINRCNLPAAVLGSLSYQRHPMPLQLDGVAVLHARLFAMLDRLDAPVERTQRFMDYMTVYFRLERLEDVGLTPGKSNLRGRADYLRMVRGWAFDPDCREGAVLKAWVESRFGLLPTYHGGSLRDRSGDNYRRYLEMCSRGLYNTNALEAQLDLLYTYGQYELQRRFPGRRHLHLFRGFNRLGDDEIMAKPTSRRWWILLNNLNSFTWSWERADEFGDHMLRTDVPLAKIFFYNQLLPGMLKSEDEYVVIGGIYEVERLF